MLQFPHISLCEDLRQTLGEVQGWVGGVHPKLSLRDNNRANPSQDYLEFRVLERNNGWVSG